MYQLEDLARTA